MSSGTPAQHVPPGRDGPRHARTSAPGRPGGEEGSASAQSCHEQLTRRLLIPTFLVFNEVDLVGTHIGLVLAYVATVLPFSIWVMRGFFVTIPVEIEEAARLDGASTRQTLTRFLFPLVMPGVIASSIFAFITAWNDYLIAYTFMKDQADYTLPVWLASFETPTGTDFSSQPAGSLIFSLPVVVFFLLIQRKLVSGMSAGAVNRVTPSMLVPRPSKATLGHGSFLLDATTRIDACEELAPTARWLQSALRPATGLP